MKTSVLVITTLLFVGLLVSCATTDFLQRRLAAEYDWDRTGGETPIHGLWVIYPVWLAVEDRPVVLRVVDAYVTSMQKAYPWSKDNISWGLFDIFIHDSTDSFVSAPPPVWCRGWICGYDIAVCWGVVRSGGVISGLAVQDCLPALPHEFMHAILRERYDAYGHELFELSSVKKAISQCKSESPTIIISPQTVTDALEYRYDPWNVPGYRE